MQYRLNVGKASKANAESLGKPTEHLTEGLHTRMNRITGITASLVFSALMLFSANAAAECACFCVSGELKTMCTTVEEAQENPVLCSAYSRMDCPEEPGERPSASYEAPEEDATNCRDLRIFDALRGVFTSVKACDVLSAS